MAGTDTPTWQMRLTRAAPGAALGLELRSVCPKPGSAPSPTLPALHAHWGLRLPLLEGLCSTMEDGLLWHFLGLPQGDPPHHRSSCL